MPESANLNKGGFTEILSVSCAAPGNRIAGGTSKDQSFHRQAIVIRETSAKWGKAVEVAGSGTLNAGGGAGVTSVSCASVRSCIVAGTYRDGSSSIQGFVATHTLEGATSAVAGKLAGGRPGRSHSWPSR